MAKTRWQRGKKLLTFRSLWRALFNGLAKSHHAAIEIDVKVCRGGYAIEPAGKKDDRRTRAPFPILLVMKRILRLWCHVFVAMGEIALSDALDLVVAHVRIQVLQALLLVCLDERKVLGPAAHRHALPAQVRKLEHVLRVNVLPTDTVHECIEGVLVALLASTDALDHDDAEKLERLSSQSSEKLAIGKACLDLKKRVPPKRRPSPRHLHTSQPHSRGILHGDERDFQT